MSYSRWFNSCWYAYHDCRSGKTKTSQVLALWLQRGEHLDIYYRDLKDWTHINVIDNYKCTEEEAIEAMTYIKEFIEDVDTEFEGIQDEKV
jgi:hypothetical protein